MFEKSIYKDSPADHKFNDKVERVETVADELFENPLNVFHIREEPK